METYELTANVEINISFKIRANSQAEAEAIFWDRYERQADAMGRSRKNITFGDPAEYIGFGGGRNEDYMP